jgi:hypothetical protein
MRRSPMDQYPDACPVCDPGIPEAALPVGDPEEANGGTLSSYECGACGTAWQTWFDRYGWPVDRSIAPVGPVQAQQHREALAAELKRRSAA